MRRIDGVAVCRCRSCDLHFVEKYPDDLSLWYGDEYYRKPGEESKIGYEDYAKLDPWYFSWSIAFVRLLAQNGALFDLGCSDGRFLKLARSAGFSKIAGIEYNESYAKLCRDSGLEVDAGDFLELNLKSEQFDVVTAWSVLEHIPALRETLQKINTMLGPKGSLFFEVPCLTGNPERDAHWLNSSLEHVLYFTEQSFATITKEIFGASFIGRVVDFANYGSTLIGFVSKDPAVQKRGAFYRDLLRNPAAAQIECLDGSRLVDLLILCLRYFNDFEAVRKLGARLQTLAQNDLALHFSSLLAVSYGKLAHDAEEYGKAKIYFLTQIEELQKALGAGTKANELLNDSLEAYQKENRQLITQISDLHGHAENLRKDLAAERQGVQELEAALSQRRQETERLKATIEWQEARLADERQHSDELQEILRRKKDDLAGLEAVLNLTREHASLHYLESARQREKAAAFEAQLSSISKLKIWRLRETLQSKESLFFKVSRSAYLLGAICSPEVLRKKVRPAIDRLKAKRRQKLYYEAPSAALPFRQSLWHRNPLISVIIPSYNYGRYIEEALNSLYQQTFQDFEVIIVDCSDDPDTIAVIRALSHPKVKVLYRKGRHLLGDNRNFGIKHARGKYVCTLDPDDILLPTYLEKAAYTLETENCQISAPSVQVFGNGDERWILHRKPKLADLLVCNHISVVALFAKQYWKLAGGYHDFGMGKDHVHEDWDFWVRMMAVGARVRNIPELLMRYRRHASNMSTAKEIPSLDSQRVTIYHFNRMHLTPRNLRRSAIMQEAEFEVENGACNLISSFQKTSERAQSVLFVLPYLVVGGAEGRFREIARYMTAIGWKVTVVTTEWFDPRQVDTTAEFEKISREIYHLPQFLEPRQWGQFVSYLTESRNYSAALLGGSSWFYEELPRFKELHPHVRIVDQQFNTSVHFISNRRCAQFIDHTVAENEVVYTELRETYREPSEKVTLLYNGVDVTALRPERKQKSILNLPGDSIVIAFIGRLSEEKGPDTFIKIAQRLARYKNFSFVLAGPGLLHEKLKEEIERQGLSGRVAMPGMVDAETYLRATDILAVPSRLDGRPNIVLEAFAMGVPVVASRVGGLPGIITDGITGFLCDPHDIDSFAERIEMLACNESLRTQVGAAARKHAESKLDSAGGLARYHQLFEGKRVESDAINDAGLVSAKSIAANY